MTIKIDYDFQKIYSTLNKAITMERLQKIKLTCLSEYYAQIINLRGSPKKLASQIKTAKEA